MKPATKKLLEALKKCFSQQAILDQLKSIIVKFVLTKLVQVVGFKAWIVKVLTEEFCEEIGEPVVKVLLARGKYKYYKRDGKIIIKRMRDAEENGDDEAYDDASDELYS